MWGVVGLTIRVRDDRRHFLPGTPIEGTIEWALERAPRNIDVRLFWYTKGRGTEDVIVVETFPIPEPGEKGRRDFEFRLPLEPHSFHGRLISLQWAIEAVASRNDAERLEFDMAPGDAPVFLPAVESGKKARRA